MMSIRHIRPLPGLRGLIQKLWVFESAGPIPDDDLKLIVPNGLPKLVIPYKNGLNGKMQGWSHLSKENGITLIGMTDIPSIVDAENDRPSGTIGVEFSAMGAYRFFHFPQSEIKNRIYPLTEVLGKVAARLQERIGNTPDVDGKIGIVQEFLLSRLGKREDDKILDFCLTAILKSGGRVSVQQLEKSTGYSGRWLNMKFADNVGISPKTYASIVRFMQFYEPWVKSDRKDGFKLKLYDYFHDRSHFLKDFKRFTGYSPAKLAPVENDFGRIFYKD
jgi:hypothetical protein